MAAINIRKQYRLNISDNVSENMQFYFDNLQDVKRFMSRYYSSSTLKAQVWEVVTTWDLSTGTLSMTQTQITEL